MSTALKDDIPIEKQYTPHRFTVQEYYRMAEAAGIMGSSHKTELIEGEVIDMTIIGSRHADWVNRLNRYFVGLVSDDVMVHIQNPIHIDDFSEPEPDLALLAPRDQSYAEAHPSAEDILLLIEVADTSLQYDSDYKAALYACHGIPEYWIIDINANQLIILREPSDDGYRSIYRPRLDEVISVHLLEDAHIDLSKLFL